MSGTRPVLPRPRRTGRRRFARWRLVSPTGAEVVSLRQLPPAQRVRVTLPSLLTSANMASGLAAVFLAFQGRFQLAAAFVALSIAFDIADGATARAIGAMTPFGLHLDSLADLISFGMAPAVLVHTWALPRWPVLAWVGGFFWLACAAFRLARFNVTIDPTADKRYFVGLPSPGAAAVVISTVFALEQPRFGPAWFAPVAVSVVPALAMVTSVRFRSFRNLLSPKTPQARLVTALVALAVLAGIFLDPAITGMAIAYAYLAQPLLGVLTAPLRERLFGPESVAPPRTRLPSVFLPSEPSDETDEESDDEEDGDDEDLPDDPDEDDPDEAEEGGQTSSPPA